MDPIGREARGQQDPVDLPLRLDDAAASPTTPQGQHHQALILQIRKGAEARPEDQCGNGSTLGEATLDVSGTFPGEAIRFPIQIAALQSACEWIADTQLISYRFSWDLVLH